MKVRDVMSRDVKTIPATGTLHEVAVLMKQNDIGSVPVAEQNRLVGMVTDRDLVIRALAEQLPSDTPVRTIMTDKVMYCFDDQDLADAVRNMAEFEVRRLPVVDREKLLVGVLSLSNVASGDDDELSGELLDGVATPH
ncbi:CBS domain-containing protein [Pseudofulvimonas gallinarii]|jgi:CBS domain-containing protein|uniref:CBS domain-containing protein n=1 Tax=Pseudofulvimonas gallinarii TaxID=634155 RepID=A0A4R3LIP2_9GAMM|nr:CBS domain-containing protein [Pseudofulvimonas gallinarii]TCT00102.1 CBS domain-containing protein [Pseudofulvimonas gallinarii]THD13571.1 inosine-5-monophosphate dehydrogenase [Pseudofulvimonas gallinarii]